MADGANRIFKIIQKSGTDTISEFMSLTVKSVNPLQLTDGDKLILTSEFLVFSDYIDISQISIGDKFKAQSYNNGQTYYISEIISSASNNIDKYITEINKLKNEINDLKRRVTALENR